MRVKSNHVIKSVLAISRHNKVSSFFIVLRMFLSDCNNALREIDECTTRNA